MNRITSLVISLIFVIVAGVLSVSAQTAAFTYQGRLTDGATAASGTYEMQFSLYNALSGGIQQGTTVTNASVSVVNGTFTVQLDFSPATPFAAGADRWLEIAVRKAADPPGFTTLTPRQQITSSPYSIRTLSAGAADSLSSACVLCVTDSHIGGVSGSKVTGTVSNATNATTAGNVSGVVAIANGGTGSATQNFVDLTTAQAAGGLKTFSSGVAGNGSLLTSLNASNISTGTVADARLTSNVALLTAAQTLTNKTLTAPVISTISNTGNLTLPTNTDTLVGRATTDTLTNKTIDSTTNTVTTDKLRSATTVVDVKSAAAPTAGQVLTATSATAATWQTPAGGAANYVYAYDTTDQTPPFCCGNLQDVTYSNNGAINGWVHPAGTATFTCPVTGLYLVQYYGRFSGTNTNIFTASMVATVNGAEVAGSQSSTVYNTLSGLTSVGPTVSKSFIISAAAGDVLRIQFAGGNTNTVLTVGTGTGTVKPSSSITITKIQ